MTSAWYTAANTVPNKTTSNAIAKTSPAADGVNVIPNAVTAAKSRTASSGKIHVDRGIGPCALIWRCPMRSRANCAPSNRQPSVGAFVCWSHSLDDILGHLLGVAEQHHRVVP